VPADATEAWISIEDQVEGDLSSTFPCHIDTAGESCFDDIGVFRAGDEP
jgi:hypothetical protein